MMTRSPDFLCLVCLALFAFGGCSGTASSPDLPELEAEVLPVRGPVWTSDREPFSVSPDGRFLVSWRQVSSNGTPDSSLHGLTFIDLASKDVLEVGVGESAKELVERGLGPSPGSICWGLDGQHAYSEGSYDRSVLVENMAKARGRTQSGKPSAMKRQPFRIDCRDFENLLLETSDTLPCRSGPPPEHELPIPKITIDQVSDKRLRLIMDDEILAEHRPVHPSSKSIFAFRPGVDNGWSRQFNLSPDGRFLAYTIAEKNRLGFAASSPGYLLDLNSNDDTTRLHYLGPGVYQFVWHPNSRELFAAAERGSTGPALVWWQL